MIDWRQLYTAAKPITKSDTQYPQLQDVEANRMFHFEADIIDLNEQFFPISQGFE